MEAEGERFYPETREEWRAWLRRFGSKRQEIWLVFNKAHTGLPSPSYNDAVEEAICFGWIDTMVRSIDESSYMQRFTPRRKGSRWSESNIRRAERMISMQKMTKAGLEAYFVLLHKPELAYTSAPKEELPVPEILASELEGNRRAYEFFGSLSKAGKNQYIRWLLDAKKEETKKRRAKRIVSMCQAGRKPGMI